MRKGNGKRKIILLMALAFLCGLALTLYPHVNGRVVDSRVQTQAEAFLGRPGCTSEEPWQEEETEPVFCAGLLERMQAYNERIRMEGQSGLRSEEDYRTPSFCLSEYGLDDEVFGVVSIPVLDLQLPIYLGATKEHMALGAAHMSQTSLPIGGDGTNCVLAGHRGFAGASYFRYLDRLQVGDRVLVTNLWETLEYEVREIGIIEPDDIEQILIRQEEDLLTLLTCHPYASGGKQRYLVICERIGGA